MYFKRIEDLRTDHDLKIRQIAEYLNTHPNVYSRYEKGTREIPVWALIKLSELYQVSTDYILGLSDEKQRRA
ncbi:MAG: helix-turn-helix transcriptional regulator [Oscillospiraceae bacterium]|nr:helix-turn-helix transcriptional regulator [Oscillospiraceae bacterium]